MDEPISYEGTDSWRHFLTSLALFGLFGGLAGLLTRYRQYQLRCKSLARFKDLKEPGYTLIEMNEMDCDIQQ